MNPFDDCYDMKNMFVKFLRRFKDLVRDCSISKYIFINLIIYLILGLFINLAKKFMDIKDIIQIFIFTVIINIFIKFEILNKFNNYLSFFSKFFYSKRSSNNLQYSFLLPFLLNLIGKDTPADAEPIIRFTFSVFVLTMIALFSFINIGIYITVIYFINKSD